MPSDFFVKQWYILWEEKAEGPFSCAELKSDPRVTPDTLVWRKGFVHWTPIRAVKELEGLFQDPVKLNPDQPISPGDANGGEAAIALNEAKLVIPPFWWWLIAIALILIWFLSTQ